MYGEREVRPWPPFRIEHEHVFVLRGERFPGPREKCCTQCCASLVRPPEEEPYVEADLRRQVWESETTLSS